RDLRTGEGVVGDHHDRLVLLLHLAQPGNGHGSPHGVLPFSVGAIAAGSASTRTIRFSASTCTTCGSCAASSSSEYMPYATTITRSPRCTRRAAAPFIWISPEPRV